MAWVRWSFGADGPGPDYCKACKRHRGSDSRCEDCTEPNLLPEAEPVIDLYAAAQTQWRVGMAGATGLDYAGLEALGRLRGTPIDPDTFGLLQICERAALSAMADQRSKGSVHGNR
jgi:hypothetical protein